MAITRVSIEHCVFIGFLFKDIHPFIDRMMPISIGHCSELRPNKTEWQRLAPEEVYKPLTIKPFS